MLARLALHTLIATVLVATVAATWQVAAHPAAPQAHASIQHDD